MTHQSITKKTQSELARLVARLGPAPATPRPADEAYDIYDEIRFAKGQRASALAAICYWCGIGPEEAVATEATWS